MTAEAEAGPSATATNPVVKPPPRRRRRQGGTRPDFVPTARARCASLVLMPVHLKAPSETSGPSAAHKHVQTFGEDSRRLSHVISVSSPAAWWADGAVYWKSAGLRRGGAGGVVLRDRISLGRVESSGGGGGDGCTTVNVLNASERHTEKQSRWSTSCHVFYPSRKIKSQQLILPFSLTKGGVSFPRFPKSPTGQSKH